MDIYVFISRYLPIYLSVNLDLDLDLHMHIYIHIYTCTYSYPRLTGVFPKAPRHLTTVYMYADMNMRI